MLEGHKSGDMSKGLKTLANTPHKFPNVRANEIPNLYTFSRLPGKGLSHTIDSAVYLQQ